VYSPVTFGTFALTPLIQLKLVKGIAISQSVMATVTEHADLEEAFPPHGVIVKVVTLEPEPGSARESFTRPICQHDRNTFHALPMGPR
jgi:hypothetical protein